MLYGRRLRLDSARRSRGRTRRRRSLLDGTWVFQSSVEEEVGRGEEEEEEEQEREEENEVVIPFYYH